MRINFERGLTIIELLIVLVILGVIFAVLGAFFASQARTTAAVQAMNEVEVKMRTAAEIVMQDLQMAGSRIVVDRSGAQPVTTYVDKLLVHCSPLEGTTEFCVKDDGSTVTVFYATSLRLATEPCRRVDYKLDDGGILQRSEVGCADTAGEVNTNFAPFAENVDALTTSYLCEDGSQTGDPAACYAGGTFPRQATVALTGRSENSREDRVATITLSTTMPNLRPVAISEAPEGG